ncbi:hypothetical protein M231_07831 [Tremella mesenterica]|uniref:Peptide hydrolase n=1 Tax=Tremella mesenterica TaxID=5217 RepID=A0A4Q1BB52_TREME|nr:hypothetical protein M231_07831 [Tremella mesenterica]
MMWIYSLLVSSLFSNNQAELVTASKRDILITSSTPLSDHPACLQTTYYGTYGGSSHTQEHIFLPSPECLTAQGTISSLNTGSIISVPPSQDGRIVWVGPAGVDPSLLPSNSDLSSTSETISSLSSSSNPLTQDETQHVIGISWEKKEIILLHRSSNSLLLQVPSDQLGILDTLLPAHLVPVALPQEPLPTLWPGVGSRFASNLANLTKTLKFDPTLDAVLNEGIQLNAVRRNVRWLTGEAPSGWKSRHAFTQGAHEAAKWIKHKVESLGPECIFFPFLPGFSPDVICHYPSLSNSTEMVILSAHYDSRGSFGLTTAPGGNDDGSGSGQLLGIVEAISSQGLQFEKQLVVAFFSGEEQGLYGSHHFAKHLYEQNATVLLHIQADMLGYHVPGEPLQLALPECIGLPEAAHLVGNVSHLYSPELVVGTTAACCSDHQSFVAYGFPATQVYERNGPIADPKYHNSGDISQREGYDFEQIVAIARVVLATAMTVAGWKIK